MPPRIVQASIPSSICTSCRLSISQTLKPPTRLLSTTPTHKADPAPTSSAASPPFSTSYSSILDSLSFSNTSTTTSPRPRLGYVPPPKPHHLHIYATKHNTHITLTTGSRNPIFSLSTGNIGFKKANRGTYDAAYQLGAYAMTQITQKYGLLKEGCDPRVGPIRGLEVVLRDFGPGREAVTKILLGSEGAGVRGRILRVMDGTRLKFGGTRSKKPRRLG